MKNIIILLFLLLFSRYAMSYPFEICFISDNPEPACFTVEADQLSTHVVQKEESISIDIDGVDIDFNCNSDKTVCEVAVTGSTDSGSTNTNTNTNTNTPNTTDSDNDGVIDTNDECPLEAGLAQNNGCPYIDYGNMVGQLSCANTDKVVCKTDTDLGNYPRPESAIRAPEYQRLTFFTDGRVLTMPFTVAPGYAESHIIVNTVRRPTNGASLRMWISLTPGGAPLGPLDCYKSALKSREKFMWSQSGTDCALSSGGGYYWVNFASCTSALNDYNCSSDSRKLPNNNHIFWLSAPAYQ